MQIAGRVVDIKYHYGATGDGVTDDRQAFQEAVDYLHSIGGGTIYALVFDWIVKR